MVESMVGRIPVPPEPNPSKELRNKQLAIATYNAVYERFEEFAGFYLERKQNGEPPNHFDPEIVRLVNGFEVAQFVRQCIVGENASVPLDTETYTYPALYYIDESRRQSFTVNEGLVVNPLYEFLEYEQNPRQGLIFRLGWDRTKQYRHDRQMEQVILDLNSRSYKVMHEEDLKNGRFTLDQRIEGEAWIISQDPWRRRQTALDNWGAAQNEIKHNRRELFVQ